MKHDILMHIAQRAGFFGTYDSSTSRIGKELGISQQSASLILRKLEKESLIARRVTGQGTRLSLTKKGRRQLETLHAQLHALCTPRNNLKGAVFSGIGEGAYYVKIYSSKIKKAIGLSSYPGTLNLRTGRAAAEHFLHGIPCIDIPAFKKGDRTFGAIALYPVRIGTMRGAVLRPKRTSYDGTVIELIAPISLRKLLRLRNGSTVEVTCEN